jgi:hypothetical protein
LSLISGGATSLLAAAGNGWPCDGTQRALAWFKGLPARNRHSVDTARLRLGWRAAKLLLELVELMGIEPMTS